MPGLKEGGKPDGKGEWLLLGLVLMIVAVTVRIAIDPNAGLTPEQYIEIGEWVIDSLGRIFDPAGPL